MKVSEQRTLVQQKALLPLTVLTSSTASSWVDTNPQPQGEARNQGWTVLGSLIALAGWLGVAWWYGTVLGGARPNFQLFGMMVRILRTPGVLTQLTVGDVNLLLVVISLVLTQVGRVLVKTAG